MSSGLIYRILVGALFVASVWCVAPVALGQFDDDEPKAKKPDSPEDAGDDDKPKSDKPSEKGKPKPPADDEEEPAAPDLKKAKTKLVQHLRSKKHEMAVAAVERLAAYRSVDAAKIILTQAFESPTPQARRAALSALAKLGEIEEVRTLLYDDVSVVLKPVKGGKTPKVSETAAFSLAALMASTDSEATSMAVELLERLAKIDAWPTVFIPLADALGAVGDETACTALLKLTAIERFAEDFGFRRSVVQALGRVRQRPAMGKLIDLLSSTRGEIHADILAYLMLVSGEKFAKDLQWRDWWTEVSETFEFPDEAAPVVAFGPKAIDLGGPRYYGLPMYGSKLVFVIDMSGSMRGQRDVAARRELTNALKELPEGIQFNIVAFHKTVSVWRKDMTISTLENRLAAANWVLAQELGPGTASYDALEAAMRFDAEAIYFLTDGAPFGGKVTQPDDICNLIGGVNRRRRVTIHAIGIGVGTPGNVFDQFLTALAARNYGIYRRVDE